MPSRISNSPALAAQPVACASASAAAAVLPAAQEPVSQQCVGIIEVFRKFRSAFLCLGGLAAWLYLSSGLSSAGPFASLSVAAAPSASNGVELAAKSAWTGLAAGVFHTLCGPDHLAGLTPLSIGRTRLAACALGALWGFGHSTGQLILGLVFALLKDRFHDLSPMLTKWSSYIVPLTLITIGLVGIYESHFHKDEDHAHDAAVEQGPDGSLALAGGGSIASTRSTGARAGFTTYATGIVHGLQPDALFVVIPALALPTKMAAVAYITMFVLGTIVSMGGYTLLIGTTSQALIKQKPWLQAHLSTIACGFAILCGVLMLLAGVGFDIPLFADAH
eukprot:CAMPEP_0202902632 /NCGR_PEP_ID=MMETSP1392-20130828/16961_1 /ASSEMBLY_ACC=CAM_ASM_000868 /TAXON_ID=225041 /ORGANISM="Chlamydomonas chlamydogama, Strain SAG 11-48b" /LENGTH=333 /DNA_ID=CAMNT_0049589425 /DNA_START=232 /DNA_END=1234 /DNA_ORIENTATION=-